MRFLPLVRAPLVLGAVLALLLAVALGACGGDASNGCSGGMTKVCLAGGVTCACAPACHATKDCAAYAVCISGNCQACSTEGCACEADICVPHTWREGDPVAFRHN